MQLALKLLVAIMAMAVGNKKFSQMTETEKQDFIKRVKEIRDISDELLKELENNARN